MLDQVKSAIRRAQERGRQRRELEAMLRLEDYVLRDIGLHRDDLHARLACL